MFSYRLFPLDIFGYFPISPQKMNCQKNRDLLELANSKAKICVYVRVCMCVCGWVGGILPMTLNFVFWPTVMDLVTRHIRELSPSNLNHFSSLLLTDALVAVCSLLRDLGT